MQHDSISPAYLLWAHQTILLFVWLQCIWILPVTIELYVVTWKWSKDICTHWTASENNFRNEVFQMARVSVFLICRDGLLAQVIDRGRRRRNAYCLCSFSRSSPPSLTLKCSEVATRKDWFGDLCPSFYVLVHP